MTAVSTDHEGTRADVDVVSEHPLEDPARSAFGLYLAGETVREAHTGDSLEPGRPVFAPGMEWACDLADAGFVIEQYTEDLFRVLVLEEHPQNAEIRHLCGGSG